VALAADTSHEIRHADGVLRIDELPDGKRRLRAEADATFVSKSECITSYPLRLIEQILTVKGLGWVCDEILRDEDPKYVSLALKFGLFSYVGEETFIGRRVLDFGCGAGASTVALARMVPGNTEIVAIDIDRALVSLAQSRARHHGLRNVRFLVSPGPDSLPWGVGEFDFIVLSAVFEHLLPDERQRVPSMLWNLLKPDGVMFINQTPHLLYPLETHTTRLPLLNYLPDRVAFAVARRAGTVPFDTTNEELRRMGLRGSTVREIRRVLDVGRSDFLAPSRLGLRDQIDIWYAQSMRRNPRAVKKIVRMVMKGLYRMAGVELVPDLNVAIRKDV
jgi:2-polyprenyl-3-methyl-5-hydroxy-6-metoxy-1,4-benzoquinol methylase